MFCSLSTSLLEEPCWSMTLVFSRAELSELLLELLEPLLLELLLPELEELPELLFPESLPEMEESVFAPATPSAERPLAFWKL